jgi:hypothetical protein
MPLLSDTTKSRRNLCNEVPHHQRVGVVVVVVVVAVVAYHREIGSHRCVRVIAVKDPNRSTVAAI